MAAQAFFPDVVTGVSSPGAPVQQKDKTSSYTILPRDNGTLFTNEGALGSVTFTLPTPKKGYWFAFSATTNQAVIIAAVSPGETIIAPQSDPAKAVAVDSIEFSSSNDIVGAYVVLHTTGSGTKWLVQKLCSNAMTVNAD